MCFGVAQAQTVRSHRLFIYFSLNNINALFRHFQSPEDFRKWRSSFKSENIVSNRTPGPGSNCVVKGI